MNGNSPVIIFGPGYTGSRLARRLISRGIPVFAVVRDASSFSRPELARATVTSLKRPELPQNARIVYSIPPLPTAESEPLHRLVAQVNPRRVIYISSTSIYGNQLKVNENSRINTGTELALARRNEEARLSAGPWSTLILRPAAIYGPGRGVHTKVRAGLLARGNGSQITSRIHIDDLVRLLEAGLESTLEAAWPVADRHPCSTDEIASWCAEYFRVPLNAAPPRSSVREGRSVDGTAIFRALGLELLWPGWQTGIPACLAEEASLEKLTLGGD